MHEGLADGPDKATEMMILKIAAERSKAATWSIPDDFLQRTHFDRAVDNLDWTSSPGYPYMKQGTTNRIFFKYEDPEGFIQMKNYVWEIVRGKIEGRFDADPTRLFIKGEPTLSEKVETGRMRLISAISVADQLIDYMLHSECNAKMVENHPAIPAKVGWSPYRGGWRQIPKQTWKSIDKRAWDWSAKLWYLDLDLKLRMKLCTNMNDEWIKLAKRRFDQLFINCTFITSGGFLLKQKTPGKIKSGMFNTITTNCNCQEFAHIRVCLEMEIDPSWLYSMGDDTIQPLVERWDEYLQRLSKYAHIKEVNENEFAGMRFTGDQIEPMYTGKHAYVLLHMNDADGQSIASSYVLFYHRSTFRNWMENYFTELG